MRTSSWLFLMVSMAALTACDGGGSIPSGSAALVVHRNAQLSVATIPNVSGTYDGTIQSHDLGSGTVTIVINQSGSTFTGTLSADFQGRVGVVNTKGTVYVSNGITHVAFSMEAARTCPGKSTGVVKMSALDGSYSVSKCRFNVRADRGTYQTVRE